MDTKKQRARRKRSIRKNISGTPERPRMAVHKTNKSIYVQIIDDVEGKTICGVSTRNVEVKGGASGGTRTSKVYAGELGTKIAKQALDKGVKKVVFDRAGYKYHGGIKALADGARKAGLEF